MVFWLIWATLIAFTAVLSYIAGKVSALLDELKDNTTATMMLREPAPWAAKLAAAGDAMQRGTTPVD